MNKMNNEVRGRGRRALLLALALVLAWSLFGLSALGDETVPYINKTLGDNGDGTYTIGLSVTGDAETESTTAADVNVIIVYDVSNSMPNNRIPLEYGGYGLQVSSGGGGGGGGTAGADGTYFQLHKYVNGFYSAVTDAENYTGTVYRYSNKDYTEYTGDRYSASTTRAQKAEKTLYDFTHALFTYQDQSDAANIQAALITFSKTGSVLQGWTSTETDITNRVSSTGTSTKLTYSQGTNWESALYYATTLLNTADKDPTYVVFITDGAPSRQGRTSGSEASNLQGYQAARDEAESVEIACKKTGGAFYGIYAFGKETDYLASLMYYAYNGTDPSSDNLGETFETEGYYNANTATALAEAINDIFQKIVSTLGVGEATISDGTTAGVTTTSGTISDLLVVDDSSFKYWLEWNVTAGENGTYTFKMNDLTTAQEITYTVTPSGDNVTITWTDTEGDNKSATYAGSVTNNILTVQWTAATDFYNYAPPAATYSDSTYAVTWNLSTLKTLLDSVTYRVTFDVWPSQTTLDLIADLKNGYITYESLDANIKKYLTQSGNDYVLATNTEATLTYTDTRTEDGEQTKTYDNPDPQSVSAAKDMVVSKKWNNTLDSRDEWKTQKITLYVTRDGTERYSVTLNEDNNWSSSAWISLGIMTVNTDGNVTLKTTGHDYSFAESIDVSYNWEIEADTVRPMKINNVDTMLVLVTGTDIPSAVSSITTANGTATVDGTTYYKLTINGTVEYYKVDSAAGALTATNHRRSYLDVVKTVTGDNVPEGDAFTFAVTVNKNASGADPDNYDSDYWVWFSIRDTNANARLKDPDAATGNGIRWQLNDNSIVTTKPDASDFNGYFCIPSGNAITVYMQDYYSLRFLNLPVGATYSISESATMPGDGYSFVSIAGERGYDADQSSTTTDDWKTETVGTVSGQSITGTIDYTESAYKVTVTNKWSTVDVQLKKVDEDGTTLLSGATFDLYTTDSDGDYTVKVGTYKPGGSDTTTDEDGNETTVTYSNPIDFGGLGLGLYKLSETVAPTYYDTAADVYFQVYKDTSGDLKARLVGSTGDVAEDQSAISVDETGDEPVYTITVKDTKKTASVKITKMVTGLDDDQNKEFTFTTTGVATEDQTAKLVGNTKLPEDSTLQHSVTYTDIPYGTSITVTETADSYFSTSYTVNEVAGTGDDLTKATFTVDDTTVNASGVVEVVFTNTRSKQLVRVHKHQTGDTTVSLEGAVFSFAGTSEGSTISYTGLETDSDGYLEYGDDDSIYFELPVDAYTLTETKAPDGYNMLTEAISITVGADGVKQSGTAITGETIEGVEGTVYTIEVGNSAGVALPHTGGPGTRAFTLIGSLLTLAALALLIAKRRAAALED